MYTTDADSNKHQLLRLKREGTGSTSY